MEIRKNSGFTSAQILITVVVVAALVFAFYKMNSQNSQNNAAEQSQMAQQAASAKMAANKKLVMEYSDAAWNQHDVDRAATYLAANFKQHNPQFPDGVEGFKAGLKYFLTAYPNVHVQQKQIFADGDYVMSHSYGDLGSGKPGDQKAIMDIFRIENGKIAEHWDVLEDIPAQAQNSNTMF